MYFPFFRGRQYDLLALKELAQNKLISNEVLPVVEPIKISSTFKSTMQAYNDAKLPIALIINPEVGDFAGADINELIPHIEDGIIPAVILNDDAEAAVETLCNNGFSKKEILVILNNRNYVADYKDIFGDELPKYTLFPDERQIRRSVSNNKVLFEDKFKKQPKNSDYLKTEDEFFSEDHLYYKDEGYSGFGDYSIIGNNYEEGGFSPRAVAIHIVYFDDENVLRVHHFVSDSNYGIEDVAGKFYEAVMKLKEWYECDQQKQLTSALSTLLDHADKGYYPGLPTIKKLSIMHHLELVNKFLNGDLH